MYLRHSEKILKLSSRDRVVLLNFQFLRLSSSPSLLSDIQLVFEQKPEEKEVWAFLSHTCAQLQKEVSKSKPLNNVPIPRRICEPERPHGKKKRESSEVGVVHSLRTLSTLGSGKELRDLNRNTSRKNYVTVP